MQRNWLRIIHCGRIVGTVEPNPKNEGLYDQLYGVYRDLYPATGEQTHTLADAQE